MIVTNHLKRQVYSASWFDGSKVCAPLLWPPWSPVKLSCFLLNPCAIRCRSLAYYLGHIRAVVASLLGGVSSRKFSARWSLFTNLIASLLNLFKEVGHG